MYKDVRVRAVVHKTKIIQIDSDIPSQTHDLFCFFSQSNRIEREWIIKNLKIYLGIKKKLRPPTWWENAWSPNGK